MKVKIAKNFKEVNICYKLREAIFVEGQGVPRERERDSEDDIATHFLLIYEKGSSIGVARVVVSGNSAVVGRFGVIEKNRCKGAGAFLMREIINYCIDNNFEEITLGAQEHAIGFYEKFNFDIIGNKYIDANIVHFKMRLKL